MNHLPKDSNDDHELSDEQLDQLLSSVKLPPVDRQRQRRLQRHLSKLLNRQQSSAPTLRIGWVASIAAVTCGAVAMVALFFQPPTPVVKTVKTSELNKEPVATTTFSTEVFTHTVWVAPRRQTPISNWIGGKLSQLRNRFEPVFDSEFGLDCLEKFTLALENERHRPGRGDQESRRTVEPFQQWRLRLERGLKQEILASNVSPEQRLLAFRKLCRCGSEQSLAFLFDHWNVPQLRPEIARIACRLADSQTIVELVEATNDSELQVYLMTQLLERGDLASVKLFLELTDRQQMFKLARRCGKTSRRLPIDRLLLALRSNQLRIVRAAAITLSAVDSKQITNHLLELARHPQTAQAAVLALTARQDNPSTRFVEAAASDLRWSATVATAQKKWNRLLAIN